MTKEQSDLEREMDETRERLAATIDQLLTRASPKTIANRQVASIKGHYIDAATGEPRTDNILKTVGAMVGTVVAFALLRRALR